MHQETQVLTDGRSNRDQDVSRQAEILRIGEIFYPKRLPVLLEELGDGGSFVQLNSCLSTSTEKRSGQNSNKIYRIRLIQLVAESVSDNLTHIYGVKGNGIIAYLLIFGSKNDAEQAVKKIREAIELSKSFQKIEITLPTSSCDVQWKYNLQADCFLFLRMRLQYLNLSTEDDFRPFIKKEWRERRQTLSCERRDAKKIRSLPVRDHANLYSGLELSEISSVSDSIQSSDNSSFSGYSLSEFDVFLNSHYNYGLPWEVAMVQEIEAMRQSPVGESAQHGNVADPTTLSQLSTEERSLQLRYWGLTRDDDLARCLSCAAEGHVSASCPSSGCSNCSTKGDHSTEACPLTQKCTKCRERGHRKNQCQSKLSRTSADGFSCDLCHRKGHTEENCARLWRTYDPDSIANPIKVRNLLVGCYQCGTNGHWGDDCKIIPRRKKSSNTNDVFSAKYADVYLIDPSNNKPNTQLNTLNQSSDEEDHGMFLGNRIGRNPRGNINIRTPKNFRSPAASKPNFAKDRSQYSSGRRRSRSPLPPPPPARYSGYSESTNALPMDTYLRSGRDEWQPPLPNEPVPAFKSSRYQQSPGQRPDYRRHSLPEKPPSGPQGRNRNHARKYNR